MGDVKVLLGNCDKLVDKLNELKQMSPQLVGKKGILHLENYTTDTPSIIFDKEK